MTTLLADSHSFSSSSSGPSKDKPAKNKVYCYNRLTVSDIVKKAKDGLRTTISAQSRDTVYTLTMEPIDYVPDCPLECFLSTTEFRISINNVIERINKFEKAYLMHHHIVLCEFILNEAVAIFAPVTEISPTPIESEITPIEPVDSSIIAIVEPHNFPLEVNVTHEVPNEGNLLRIIDVLRENEWLLEDLNSDPENTISILEQNVISLSTVGPNISVRLAKTLGIDGWINCIEGHDEEARELNAVKLKEAKDMAVKRLSLALALISIIIL